MVGVTHFVHCPEAEVATFSIRLLCIQCRIYTPMNSLAALFVFFLVVSLSFGGVGAFSVVFTSGFSPVVPFLHFPCADASLRALTSLPEALSHRLTASLPSDEGLPRNGGGVPRREAKAATPVVLEGPRAASGEQPTGEHQQQHHHHEHGVACGHHLVADKQTRSVEEFKTFVATTRGGAADGEPSHDHQRQRQTLSSQQGSQGSPATIRIAVEYQLGGNSLLAAQQQAIQTVMDTAVRVIKKFVKVGACCMNPDCRLHGAEGPLAWMHGCAAPWTASMRAPRRLHGCMALALQIRPQTAQRMHGECMASILILCPPRLQGCKAYIHAPPARPTSGALASLARG